MEIPSKKHRSSLGVDMQYGEPYRCIARFALPLLLGNLLQYLYTAADAAVVGRYLGREALAAVGTCGPLINLMVGMFIGLSMGAGIFISQQYGAGAMDKVYRTVKTAAILTVAIGILITILGLVMSDPFLRVMGVDAALRPISISYLTVIFGGILISMLYNLAAAILRALSDSLTPLYALLVASLLNIVLDVLLVGVFHRGVQGTAWATILSQLVSLLFSGCRIRKIGMNVQSARTLRRIDWGTAAAIARLGIPSAIQQTAYSMGTLVVQSVINRFGVLAMATYVVVMKLDNICSLPTMSFGVAATTFAGQCIGAGKVDRVVQGGRQGLLLGLGVTVPLAVLIFLLGKWPLMLFTADPQLLSNSFSMLRILCPFYPLLVIVDIYSGQLRGMGNTLMPMLNSSISLFAVRVPVLLLLYSLTANQAAIYWSVDVSCLFGAVFIFLYYHFGKWRVAAGMERHRIKRG